MPLYQLILKLMLWSIVIQSKRSETLWEWTRSLAIETESQPMMRLPADFKEEVRKWLSIRSFSLLCQCIAVRVVDAAAVALSSHSLFAPKYNWILHQQFVIICWFVRINGQIYPRSLSETFNTYFVCIVHLMRFIGIHGQSHNQSDFRFTKINK